MIYYFLVPTGASPLRAFRIQGSISLSRIAVRFGDISKFIFVDASLLGHGNAGSREVSIPRVRRACNQDKNVV